jgi:Tol biopolymer transport system component
VFSGKLRRLTIPIVLVVAFTTLASKCDKTPPSVRIVAPVSGATVGGTTDLVAEAKDEGTVVAVTFLLFQRGRLTFRRIGVAQPTANGWAYRWDTRSVPSDSSYTLKARAVDRAGNWTLSAGVPLAVNNSTERVSVSSTGTEAGDGSFAPDISPDGRFVVFGSAASNLVEGDTNGQADIFVADRRSRKIERVNVSGSGGQANAHSFDPAITPDGRFVAFSSFAANLVTGDTNAHADVFVFDRVSRTTERVSLSGTGAEANADVSKARISRDGRFVAFATTASNLVPGDTNHDLHFNPLADVFVRDRQTATTERVSLDTAGHELSTASRSPALDATGRYVAFEAANTVLLRDRQTQTTSTISPSGGVPSMSADARFVAYFATNPSDGLHDVFVYDRTTGVVERVTTSTVFDQFGVGAEFELSADGRHLALTSDLAFSPANLYEYDRVTGSTTLVSVPATGGTPNLWSEMPAISGDGRFVAFASFASNLVPADANGQEDIFVRDTLAG